MPQKIERFEAETNRPLDLALMVDSSMSALKELKLETEAAAHFIRQVVRPGDTLGVFEFDEIVTELSEFSSDVPRLQSAARHIYAGCGHFNLRCGRTWCECSSTPPRRPPPRDCSGDRWRRDNERLEI